MPLSYIPRRFLHRCQPAEFWRHNTKTAMPPGDAEHPGGMAKETVLLPAGFRVRVQVGAASGMAAVFAGQLYHVPHLLHAAH